MIVLLMALDFYPVGLPGTPVACLPAYSVVAQDPDRHAACSIYRMASTSRKMPT